MNRSKIRNIGFVSIGDSTEVDLLKKQVLEVLRPKMYTLQERPGDHYNVKSTYESNWFKFTNWFNNNGII